MKDVLANYRPGVAFDEMMDTEGSVRPSYQAVYRSLEEATPAELRLIAESLASNYTQAGVTFDIGGVERPFPLDLVPRVIASAEWETIETGVAQRVRALEAFLDDVYTDARVITDGVIPRQLVTSSKHYHRAVWGIRPGNGGRIHVAGVDLMRTTAGLQRVDVIYRRIDDDFIDPVHFRSDSMLGVPGLVNAVRTGGVALANALGNGVADDKLLYTYVPDLIRYYLSEEPIIGNIDTWRLEEDEAREEVLDRLDELVVKPVDGSGGKGIVIGPHASPDELAALRARVTADPRGWIAQPLVQLSTVPTLIENSLAPRHVDLRPFAVNNGEEVWVLPGGLTRVALPEGELVVNSSQGGGSKDTWVLSPPLHRPYVEESYVSQPEAADDEEPDGTMDDQLPPARRASAVPLLVSRPQELAPVPEIAEQRQQPEQQQQAEQQQRAAQQVAQRQRAEQRQIAQRQVATDAGTR
jgi:uncharacterized circularly permuted ATP-grasp superfamily protein